MSRTLPAIAAALLLAGCGSSNKTNTAQSQTAATRAQDARDVQAVQSQVDQEVDNKLQARAVAQNTFVQSSTTCTKQSDTAYKCLTTFTSPPNQPDAVTDVTCGRSGGSCITETHQ